MRLALTLFCLSFALGLSAQEKNLGDLVFRRIPESDALLSFGLAQHGQLSPESVKLLVWNIKKTQEDHWSREFRTYSQGADLLVLQEAYLSARFNRMLLEYRGYRWDMGVSFLYRQDAMTPTGVMIGSNVRPSDVRVNHTVDFEPLVKTPKATLYTTYPVQGSSEELLVVSVHAINLTSLATFKRHVAQMKERILAHQGPVVWAGDFNTRTKKRTAHLMQVVGELGLTPVKFKNGHHRMVFAFTKNYLDHVFVRGLRVRHAEVIPDSRGSDHRPMLLELALL